MGSHFRWRYPRTKVTTIRLNSMLKGFRGGSVNGGGHQISKELENKVLIQNRECASVVVDMMSLLCRTILET